MTTSICKSFEQLAEWEAETLSASASLEISEHMFSCSVCRELIQSVHAAWKTAADDSEIQNFVAIPQCVHREQERRFLRRRGSILTIAVCGIIYLLTLLPPCFRHDGRTEPPSDNTNAAMNTRDAASDSPQVDSYPCTNNPGDFHDLTIVAEHNLVDKEGLSRDGDQLANHRRRATQPDGSSARTPLPDTFPPDAEPLIDSQPPRPTLDAIPESTLSPPDLAGYISSSQLLAPPNTSVSQQAAAMLRPPNLSTSIPYRQKASLPGCICVCDGDSIQ